MAESFIVDVQNHVLPLDLISGAVTAGIVDASALPATVKWRGITFATSQDMVDVDKHMRACTEAGLTHVMLHMPMVVTIAYEVMGMPAIEAARVHNDTMAEIRDRYPDIVFPYGTVRPHDGAQAVEEAARCIDELGFKALAIDTSYGTTDRLFPHTVECFEFWEYVNDMGIAVYVHPAMLCYGWEWMDRYKFDETVARPAETALCASLMIMTGLFDRFPQLRIILAHMGGGFPMCLSRLEFGHRLGYDGIPEYQKPKNIRAPREYVRENLWADTMGFDAAGIRHAIEVFGVDHVMLGTDYGPIPISPAEHIDIVRHDLGLTQAEQEKILGLNAKELFGLTAQA
ncbi:MAG: amidohydrolase family protein [Actinomycetota bacterium]